MCIKCFTSKYHFLAVLLYEWNITTEVDCKNARLLKMVIKTKYYLNLIYVNGLYHTAYQSKCKLHKQEVMLHFSLINMIYVKGIYRLLASKREIGLSMAYKYLIISIIFNF